MVERKREVVITIVVNYGLYIYCRQALVGRLLLLLMCEYITKRLTYIVVYKSLDTVTCLKSLRKLNTKCCCSTIGLDLKVIYKGIDSIVTVNNERYLIASLPSNLTNTIHKVTKCYTCVVISKICRNRKCSALR